MEESTQSGAGVETLDIGEEILPVPPPEIRGHSNPPVQQACPHEQVAVIEAPLSVQTVRPNKRRLTSPPFMVGYFAVLNVVMYLTIHKFWIGGSSFLPMVGKLGEGNKFLFAMLVNVGVIVGAFIGAYSSGEFRLRFPKRRDLAKSMIGGALIGMGVTIAPGTCTTAFVTGLPMLSVSSLLSIAGIFIGAHIVYRHTLGRR